MEATALDAALDRQTFRRQGLLEFAVVSSACLPTSIYLPVSLVVADTGSRCDDPLLAFPQTQAASSGQRLGCLVPVSVKQTAAGRRPDPSRSDQTKGPARDHAASRGRSRRCASRQTCHVNASYTRCLDVCRAGASSGICFDHAVTTCSVRSGGRREGRRRDFNLRLEGLTSVRRSSGIWL